MIDTLCGCKKQNLNDDARGLCFNEKCDHPWFCIACLNTKHHHHSNDCQSFEQILQSINNFQSSFQIFQKKIQETQEHVQITLKKFFPYLTKEVKNLQEQIIDWFNIINLKQSIKSASYFIEKMQNILKSHDEFFIAIQGWTKHQGNQSFKIVNLNSEGQTDKAFSLYNQNPLSEASSDKGQSIESAATYYSVPPTQFQIMPLNLFNQNPSKPHDHDQQESTTNDTIIEKEEIKQIDEEIKNDPNNSSLYLQKTKILLKQNRLNEAVDILIQAFSIGYGRFDIWLETGIILMKLNCVPEALQCFDQAYLLDSNNFELNQNYRKALLYFNNDYLAIEYCDNALERNHANALALAQKGQFLCDLKCFTESIKCFNQSINLGMKPEFVENSFNEALNFVKKFENTIQQCNSSIELKDGNQASFLHIKGGALMKLNRIVEAIECFDSSIKLNPQNAEVYCDQEFVQKKGKCLQTLGRFPEAINCFKTALALDPQNQVYLDLKEQAIQSLINFFYQVQGFPIFTAKIQ